VPELDARGEGREPVHLAEGHRVALHHPRLRVHLYVAQGLLERQAFC